MFWAHSIQRGGCQSVTWTAKRASGRVTELILTMCEWTMCMINVRMREQRILHVWYRHMRTAMRARFACFGTNTWGKQVHKSDTVTLVFNLAMRGHECCADVYSQRYTSKRASAHPSLDDIYARRSELHMCTVSLNRICVRFNQIAHVYVLIESHMCTVNIPVHTGTHAPAAIARGGETCHSVCRWHSVFMCICQVVSKTCWCVLTHLY